MLQAWTPRIWMVSVFSLLVLAVGGCQSHASVRGQQDWTGDVDPRFYRVCHVTNYGSGVCIARAEDYLLILANAHVVGDSKSVTVYLPSSRTLEYQKFKADVIASAHPTKIDLALLIVHDPPPGPSYKLNLAPDFEDGEYRESVELLDITTPDSPLIYEGPIVEHTILWAGAPDDFGSQSYDVSVGCLHGGILQANSGSPIFEGDRLVGIHHYSLFEAPVRRELPDGGSQTDTVRGLGVTTPARIRAFLEANNYDYVIE